MTRTPKTPADRLAECRDGAWYPARNVTPFRPLLDGTRIETLDARGLATRYAVPFLQDSFDLFRGPAGELLARPRGTDTDPAPLALPAVADLLRAAILALPDRTDVGRPYDDLRTFLTVAPHGQSQRYLLDVAQAVRRSAPRWQAPAAPREPKPVLSDTERRQASTRARQRTRMAAKLRYRATALDFLEATFLEASSRDDDLTGDRITVEVLLSFLDDFLISSAASDSFGLDGTNHDSRGRAELISETDNVLGLRRNGRGYGRHWRVPDRNELAANIAHARAKLALDRNGFARTTLGQAA